MQRRAQLSVTHGSSAGGGRALTRQAHAQLMNRSSKLPAVPMAFDSAKQYRVRLNRTVDAMPDGSHKLRPSEDVVVSGTFAETIRDAISSAQAL